MRNLLPIGMIIATAAACAWADGPVAATTQKSAITIEGFARTYADAQKAAKAQDKPMYLHFTTTWCGWCRKIEHDCYAMDEGKKALAGFSPASLDCTVAQGKTAEGEVKTNLELMQKFGGKGYPFIVILTPDGELVHSWAGYLPLEAFQKESQGIAGDIQGVLGPAVLRRQGRQDLL